MIIKFNNSAFVYQFKIQYFYKDIAGSVATSSFDDIASFEAFMKEAHPDVNLNDVSTKYAKHLEMLQTKASKGEFNKDYSYTYIYCFIGGDTLYSSSNYVVIQEKMVEYFKGQENVNEGYISTFPAKCWSFQPLEGKVNGFKVEYWYDKDTDVEGVYKIHTFKDKVIFEQPNGNIHSMIVSDQYYIHYEGKKKPS